MTDRALATGGNVHASDIHRPHTTRPNRLHARIARLLTFLCAATTGALFTIAFASHVPGVTPLFIALGILDASLTVTGSYLILKYKWN